MMTTEGNADSKWSEKKMEGEDTVRTVDSLRGRLLAERMASRNANQEAELLGQKLIELETHLKQEAKSRNRAEKKLKFLLKKLESRNISYVSEESEQSSLVDMSGISSVSTSPSSRTKETDGKFYKSSILCKSPETEGIEEKAKELLENLPRNYSEMSAQMHQSDGSSATEGSSVESPLESESQTNDKYPISLTDFEQNEAKFRTDDDSLTLAGEDCLEKSSKLVLDHKSNDSSKLHEQGFESCSEKEGLNEKDDHQDQIDNSMALVLIDDAPGETTTEIIDPEVLDATVKQVLDSLRCAKERIQSSMERRRRINMIKVG